MKRIFAAAFVLVFLLSGCSLLPQTPKNESNAEPATLPVSQDAPTVNQTVYETYFVVNCDESISMYFSADISSPVLCTIPLGESVSYIQSAENGFYRIAYQGSTGYALATCLSTTPPEQISEYVTYYVVNCNEYITLRSAPSTEASAVCKIPLGVSVSYIGTADNGFYQISYMGNTGYALASYLSQDPNAHSQPQDNGYHSQEVYATCYVVNCNESITLRKSPSTGAGEYCQIPYGAAVSYIETASNGFYKVIYNGQTGYALASYLSFSGPSDPYYDSIVYLQVVNCKESITLRTAPSVNADEYCQIPLGSYVEYLDYSENGFYLVAYNGYIGYALASYLC